CFVSSAPPLQRTTRGGDREGCSSPPFDGATMVQVPHSGTLLPSRCQDCPLRYAFRWAGQRFHLSHSAHALYAMAHVREPIVSRLRVWQAPYPLTLTRLRC